MEETSNSGPTEISLYTHFMAIIDEREKRYEDKFIAKGEATEISVASSEKATKIAMDAADKALILASEAAERRFASIDLLRTSIQEQASTFLPRTEYVVAHEALVDTLNTHILSEQEKNATQEEKQDGKLEVVKERVDAVNKWLLGLMGGVVIALLLTIVDIVLRIMEN